MPQARASTEKLAGLALLLTMATILGAWAFEVVGGYVPCPLCLKQRWPYYFAVPVLALAWLRLKNHDADLDVARWGLIVVALVMFAGAVTGAYHSGVEWGWWQGPAECASGAGLSGGLPDLNKIRVVSCSEAQWRFLGLSFAGWNVLISLAVTALCAIGARRIYGSSSVSQ